MIQCKATTSRPSGDKTKNTHYKFNKNSFLYSYLTHTLLLHQKTPALVSTKFNYAHCLAFFIFYFYSYLLAFFIIFVICVFSLLIGNSNFSKTEFDSREQVRLLRLSSNRKFGRIYLDAPTHTHTTLLFTKRLYYTRGGRDESAGLKETKNKAYPPEG